MSSLQLSILIKSFSIWYYDAVFYGNKTYCLSLLKIGVYSLSHNKVRNLSLSDCKFVRVFLPIRVGVYFQVFYFH
jgi:hypothetical protein